MKTGPITVGADATLYIWFLGSKFVELWTKVGHLLICHGIWSIFAGSFFIRIKSRTYVYSYTVASGPALKGSIFIYGNSHYFLAQCQYTVIIM